MAINIGIYAGTVLSSDGASVVSDLRQSGFTTVYAFGLQVQSDGSLTYGPTTAPLVSWDTNSNSFQYTGDPSWPDLLASLTSTGSSVNRVLFSMGSGGPSSGNWTNVSSLLTLGGGTSNPLYLSIQVLAAALPMISGIDLDYEPLGDWDEDMIIGFSQLLSSLGLAVTFCPYMNMDNWISCLSTLNAGGASVVTGFNLQTYSSTPPSDWITAIQSAMGSDFDAAAFVSPGMWAIHSSDGGTCNAGSCPGEVESQFSDWQPLGIQGGWIWNYNTIQSCAGSGCCSGASMDTAAYASAIATGLTPSQNQRTERQGKAR